MPTFSREGRLCLAPTHPQTCQFHSNVGSKCYRQTRATVAPASYMKASRKEKVCIDEDHLSKHISPHQNYQESVENFCWINYIRNLEPNCQYSCSSCSSSSEIVAKSLPPPLNLCRPLKTFACVSLRYRKCHGGVGGNSGSGLW